MRKALHQPDYSLIALLFIVIVFGLVMLSSATSVLGYDKFTDSYWYLKHQMLLGFLPGLLLFFVLSKINYQRLKKFYVLFFAASIILLMLVFIPGVGADFGTGSRSWIYFLGISFQPAEIIKLTFLIFIATWLDKRQERLASFAYGFVPFMLYVGIMAALIIAQPDIGTLSIFLLIVFLVYFVAGAKWKHLGLIIIGAFTGLGILIKIAPYRMARLTAFLDPSADPQGVGYHINQALLAIGSGGWFGLGLGQSRQKFQYLPEVAGDSIFAIMAEELGFVLMLILIVLFLWMFIRMIKIAERAPDTFGYLLTIGIAVWLTGQFFVNVGAMLGILPLTGLPLPLISYGGTSMIAIMAAMGIVVNISKQTQ